MVGRNAVPLAVVRDSDLPGVSETTALRCRGVDHGLLVRLRGPFSTRVDAVSAFGGDADEPSETSGRAGQTGDASGRAGGRNAAGQNDTVDRLDPSSATCSLNAATNSRTPSTCVRRSRADGGPYCERR